MTRKHNKGALSNKTHLLIDGAPKIKAMIKVQKCKSHLWIIIIHHKKRFSDWTMIITSKHKIAIVL